MINRQVINTLEALCLDCLDCGVPRDKVMSHIILIGQMCLELEVYEYMEEIHRVHDTVLLHKTNNIGSG